jgi:polyhydroxyalkanoate synthesis regulator phasin
VSNSQTEMNEGAVTSATEGLNGHSDILEHLRQEVQQQRELLAQLSADGGNQATISARSDAILLRVGELERKVGEGTSDPIINEIVSRLSEVEESARSKVIDPRVDELAKQLSGVKKSINKAAGSDSQDDTVLRIAALEGRLIRADELDERLAKLDALIVEKKELVDDVAKRIETLESNPASEKLESRVSKAELDLTHLNTLSEAVAPRDDVESLRERLTELESSSSEPQKDERVDELQQRLADLEGHRAIVDTKLEEVDNKPSQDERVDSLQTRLSDVEEFRTSAEAKASEDDPRLSQLDERLQAVESRPVAEPISVDLEAIQAKLAEVETSLQLTKNDETVTTLTSRVDQVEQLAKELAEKTPDEDVWRSPLGTLTTRVYELEQKPSGVPDDIESRLAAVESKPEPTVDDSKFDEISTRLKSLEERESASSEVVIPAELDQRIAALETASSNPTAPEFPALDSLESRLAALESAPAPSAPQGLDEIESRLLKLEDAPSAGVDPASLDAIESKLLEKVSASGSSLESRLLKLEDTPSAEVDQASLDAIESKLLEKVSASGGSPDLSELIERIDTLESWSSTSAPEIDDDTIAKITERVSTTTGAGRVVEILERLDHVESRAVQGDDDSASAELAQRLFELEEKLEGWGAAGDSDSSPKIAQLQAQVTKLTEASQDEAATGGVAQETLDALSRSVAAGVELSEIRSIKMQLIIVFGAIVMLFTMCAGMFLLQT